MYDPTNFPDELNRKAYDALIWLVNQKQQKTISDASFRVGMISIWNCVSGLVDATVEEQIDALVNHTASMKGEEKTSVWVCEQTGWGVILRWEVGSTKVTCDYFSQGNRTIQKTGVKDFNLNSPKDASDYFDRTEKYFESNGFKRF